MSPLIRRGAIVGVVAATAFAAWKFLATRAPGGAGVTYETQPFPMPPRPVVPTSHAPSASAPTTSTATPTTATASGPTMVAPDASGNCPPSHPIKGKHSSGIYHQPGGFAYQRTHADACYVDTAAAEDNGLRAAKR